MKYVSPPLPTAFLLAIFVFSGLMGCNGQPIPTAALPTSTTERVAETAEPLEEAVTEEVAETEANEAVSSAVSDVVAACSSINIPGNPLIGEVSESDWSKGAASAPITLIEYADFQ